MGGDDIKLFKCFLISISRAALLLNIAEKDSADGHTISSIPSLDAIFPVQRTHQSHPERYTSKSKQG